MRLSSTELIRRRSVQQLQTDLTTITIHGLTVVEWHVNIQIGQINACSSGGLYINRMNDKNSNKKYNRYTTQKCLFCFRLFRLFRSCFVSDSFFFFLHFSLFRLFFCSYVRTSTTSSSTTIRRRSSTFYAEMEKQMTQRQ